MDGYGRFVSPIGVSLIVGAAVFGIGMQITNGCGSGTLVAAGQGSRRMWVALPFFCLGGVMAVPIQASAAHFTTGVPSDRLRLVLPAGGNLRTDFRSRTTLIHIEFLAGAVALDESPRNDGAAEVVRAMLPR